MLTTLNINLNERNCINVIKGWKQIKIESQTPKTAKQVAGVWRKVIVVDFLTLNPNNNLKVLLSIKFFYIYKTFKSSSNRN